MLCPKCGHPNTREAAECNHCNVLFKDVKGLTSSDSDHQCGWNDHGARCGRYGHLSPSLGKGNWYCQEHYYKLMGWDKSNVKPQLSYRERWYAARGLPYETPRGLGPSAAPFLPVHTKAPVRQREPGDDDDIPVPL